MKQVKKAQVKVDLDQIRLNSETKRKLKYTDKQLDF